MGYLFLLIAVFSGTVKGYCGKKTGNLTADIRDAVSVNLIRMLICIGIGVTLLLIQNEPIVFSGDSDVLWIMAGSGIFTSLFLITWLLSVKQSAYLLLEISLMMGILVPIGVSAVLFDEAVRLHEWLGIACLILATCIMGSYNNSQKKKLTPTSLLLLFACGLCCGLSDLMQKLFVKEAPTASVSSFNLYTYLVAFLVLLPMLFLFKSETSRTAAQSVKKVLSSAFRYILIMAACLFVNSYFKTLAAKHLDAAQLYPLSQGSSLILSSVMASVLFKEKFTFKCAVGVLTAFIGLLLLNVFSF